MQAPRWEFDASPPSGARRGGDPAEYAFTRTLDTFVREALQNANDQSPRRGSVRAEVHFDVEELKGAELKEFRAAIEWDALARHLQGAAAVKGIRKFRAFADAARGSSPLVLLRVEDRDTSELVGGEDESDSNFCALCRDSLFSHKHTTFTATRRPESRAGGSCSRTSETQDITSGSASDRITPERRLSSSAFHPRARAKLVHVFADEEGRPWTKRRVEAICRRLYRSVGVRHM